MRKIPHCILFLLVTTTIGLAEKLPKADHVLAEAKAKAATEHKAIFLIFGASWCADCHTLDSFLKDREVAAIFDKYFVIAHLSVAEELADHSDRNNSGSMQLLQKFGGVSGSGEVGLPFFVVLDSKGSALITSKRPVKGKPEPEGIGFPTEPEEISWFLDMFKRGTDGLTPEEAHVLQDKLRKG